MGIHRAMRPNACMILLHLSITSAIANLQPQRLRN